MLSLARPETKLPAPMRLIPVILALATPSLALAEQTVTTVVADPDAKPAVERRTPHFSTYAVRGAEPRGTVDGMGVFATAKDTSVDLTSPDHMVSGPSGSLFNQAAGIGWRNHNMSAMVGYMKPSSVHSATQFRSDDYTPSFKSSARVGLGFSLHF